MGRQTLNIPDHRVMNTTPSNLEPERVSLAGGWVHKLTMTETIDRIDHAIAAHQGGWVVTPNLDILHKLTTDDSFAKLVEPATIRVADGMPLIWASKIAGNPLPERVAGSDLVWHLCERAAERGYSIFLLGGDEGIAERAARVLEAKYPGLRIAGTHCPPFGFEKDPEHMDLIRSKLSQTKPTIVLVALGCPKQERLIDTLRHDFQETWFFGIGISLSFVTGDVRRAPAWARKLGLEWAHRLLQEPGRLARRYLVVGIPFAARLFIGAALARFRG